eukprot:TRINITY_DN904_c0_g1_i14.p1 TRINITY_DN904_c0_g1~~TRINITY_DN904_c0_g1_i14.p1  ORF type:complete len:661 (-),score=47.80 TRINITY_DN904_c0_g1_i14:1255-3237(-)
MRFVKHLLQLHDNSCKYLLYGNTDEERYLMVLTHMDGPSCSSYFSSIDSSCGHLYDECSEASEDDINASWSLISCYPDCKALVQDYYFPYSYDSLTDVSSPAQVVSSFSSNDSLIVFSHIDVSRMSTNPLISIAFELSKGSHEDIMSVIKYIASETCDDLCIDVIDSKYPYLTPVKGTMVDVGCYLLEKRRDVYDSLRSEMVKYSLNNLVSKTKSVQDSISMLLYAYTFPNVVCVDVSKEVFYVFSNGWKREEGGMYFHRLMINEMMNRLPKHSKIFSSHRMRESIIRSLAVRTESRSFESMLNTRANVVAMANCVYDSKEHRYRKPLPRDYATMSTNTSISPALMSSDGCESVMSVLRKVFPDPDVLLFWITTVSLVFAGRNAEKIIPIWIGKTDSAKSTCQKMVEYALGDYAGVLPTSVLTDKKPPSHGTTSALSSMNKKRIMFLQEPEDHTINSAQLKSLTGNDRQYTREIFEKAKYMSIMSMVVIVSNGILDLTKCDEAALSRVVVIPFVSTFITSRMMHRYKSDVDDVRIHLADPSFEEKLESIAPYFFHILTVAYSEYLVKGLTIPDVVKETTEMYVMRCNPMLHFIKTHIEMDPESQTSIYSMYEGFKNWMRKTSPSKPLPSLHSFLNDLRSNGLENDGSFFVGMSLRSNTGF